MFSWHVFLIGAVLGVVQFGLGLWIGKVVYDRRKLRQDLVTHQKESGYTDVREDTQRLQTITSRIQSTVHRISSDVSNHQVRIEQMTRELHTLKTRSVSIAEEVIWERLNQLLRMTADFSSRLSDAESQIQTQSKQIDIVAQSQNLFGEKVDDHQTVSDAESLIPGEMVESVVSLGAVYGTQEENVDVPEDMDVMLESVRSRLTEVMGSVDKE